MMTTEDKEKIDNMSYESMLSIWRFAPLGHKLFIGDTGKYFSQVMKEKAEKLSDDEKVSISKRLGWES